MTDAPPGFAVELHCRTAGIPFDVDAVLRDPVGVPIPVRDSMSARLAELGDDGTALVRAAAVLDAPATEEELAAVSGVPLGSVGQVVTNALAAAVLFEWDTERYCLRHPLARQAVHTSIPRPLRRALHLRAADLLSAHPSQAAHHHRQAGDVPNWVSRTVTAIDQAAAAGDTSPALRVLENALADDLLPTHAVHTLATRLNRLAVIGVARATVPAARPSHALRFMSRIGVLPSGVDGEVLIIRTKATGIAGKRARGDMLPWRVGTACVQGMRRIRRKRTGAYMRGPKTGRGRGGRAELPLPRLRGGRRGRRLGSAETGQRRRR
ncbi:hypothetical protein ALI144C_35605 [Actinosynnema sp. ALI-1.44]|uniref:hypothetical protein n=1 Tax=Actinosynnema sp. ALI-1.44 TaxID=1933779 RepID=UPI00097C5907|nr:hypothetical protein [Actinosynnema sp. ALI-1.44]ONI76035.1 hypothetical protein ALI144C_35605 [Actinosynnema sp. ALI-1.44]